MRSLVKVKLIRALFRGIQIRGMMQIPGGTYQLEKIKHLNSSSILISHTSKIMTQ